MDQEHAALLTQLLEEIRGIHDEVAAIRKRLKVAPPRPRAPRSKPGPLLSMDKLTVEQFEKRFNVTDKIQGPIG